MTTRYSRRAFLAATGAAGAATVLAGANRAFGATGGAARTGAMGAAGSAAVNRAVAALRRSAFAPLVGSKFRLLKGAASQPLVLEHVAALPGAGASSEGQFSLLLRGNRSTAWEQGTYDLHHRAIGTVRLLVVPVDRGVRARRYQIIVNRA